MDFMPKYFSAKHYLSPTFFFDYFCDVERYSSLNKSFITRLNIWIYHTFCYACMAHFIFLYFYSTTMNNDKSITNVILGGYHRFLPNYPKEGYFLCVCLYILNIPFFKYLYCSRHFDSKIIKVYKYTRRLWQNNVHVVLFDNWYTSHERRIAKRFMTTQFFCYCCNRKYIF